MLIVDADDERCVLVIFFGEFVLTQSLEAKVLTELLLHSRCYVQRLHVILLVRRVKHSRHVVDVSLLGDADGDPDVAGDLRVHLELYD